MIHTLPISNCVGPTSPVPLQGNLIQCMYHAKDLGFDGVELHMRNAKLDDYHELRHYADKLGIRITSIGTGMACYADGHYMTNPDPEKRKEAQQVLIDFAEAGSIAGGAMVMFGLMKGPLPEPRLREKYKDILFESLQPVVDACEKYNVDLTIEAINRFQSAYLWSTEETLEFVNRFPSRHVTIHLDTFHMNIEDKDMEAAIRMSKDRLGHFHFSDSDRCYPGHGHVDYKMCVDTLYDIGYMENGLGGYEYDCIPDGVEAAKRGLAYIKSLMH